MSLALLFPGQGVQHAAMLPWLDANPLASATLAAMAGHIGADWRDRLDDDAWSSGNLIAQCLLTGVCLATFRAIAGLLPRPVAMAGYSVGELAACAAASMFDDSEALRVAQRRAAGMDVCAAAVEGGLLSVSKAPAALIEAACERFGLAVAIRIAVDQCVLGGPAHAITAAAPTLAAAGAELVPLRVRVASHTPLMASAAIAFAEFIAPLRWRPAAVVLASNYDGRGRRDAGSLKHALAEQIASTVQWDRCMDTVAERGPRCVLEIGPGASLSRMWSARYPDIPARSADEFHSADAVANWVSQTLG